MSDVDGPEEATITIDPHGRLLESKGEAPLPYLLGDLSELVVEPLPQAEQASWTISGDPGVAVVSLHIRIGAFRWPGFREGVPAVEKTVYTVEGQADKLITIAKHYEMTSAATLAGKPRIEATGDGKLKFDTERGVFASLDFDMRVTVRDANKTEETPLHISYRLLSEEDIAERGKGGRGGQEGGREGQARKGAAADGQGDRERRWPIWRSDDAERVRQCASCSGEKKPK